jgi:oligoribonuclease (3'-5' exoribonuclease)
MTEEEKEEWKKAFTDIEESIEEMELREEQLNPNAKYLRMKQQSLF